MKSTTATKKGPGRVHQANTSVRKDRVKFRGQPFAKLARKASLKELTVRN